MLEKSERLCQSCNLNLKMDRQLFQGKRKLWHFQFSKKENTLLVLYLEFKMFFEFSFQFNSVSATAALNNRVKSIFVVTIDYCQPDYESKKIMLHSLWFSSHGFLSSISGISITDGSAWGLYCGKISQCE